MEKKSALIVDDECLILKIISDILKKEGYEVKTASTHNHVLQLIKNNFFHVAVIDIRMPGKSGVELLEEIRTVNDKLPVILMTGYASLETAIKAVHHGAFDYLTKPLDYNKLKQVIKHAVDRYELVNENHRLLSELKELNASLEEKVSERNRELENILTSAHESIITTDMDLVIKTANLRTADIFGGDCVGRKLNELIGGINFDSVVPQLLSESSIVTKHEVSFDDRFVVVTLSPLVDSQTSDKFGLIAITDDITEQKKMEVQLIQSAKMSAIGQLASGLAHEFNNILSAIMATTGLAMLRENFEDIRRDLQLIDKASCRASEVIGKLLSFARPKGERFQLASLDKVLEDAVSLIRESFSSAGIKMLLQSTQIPPIRMNVTEIQQVILNLALNSKHAMPEGGMIIINTYVDDGYVKIAFSDTGKGIPKENLPKIFDPFFTTTDADFPNRKSGTGLGLSVVYAIVDRHGGHISVSSEVGMGTTFTITLPDIQHLSTVSEDSEPQIDKDFKPNQFRKKGNILVVDDEEMICDVIRDLLLSTGHNVVTANNGEKAIEEVRNNHFDIVFLDIIMPRINGLDVLKEIKTVDPSTVVVMISGDTKENLKDQAMGEGAFSFINKPFTLPQIRNTVTRILSA